MDGVGCTATLYSLSSVIYRDLALSTVTGNGVGERLKANVGAGRDPSGTGGHGRFVGSKSSGAGR